MKRSTAPCEARSPLCHAGQGGPRELTRSPDVDNFSARGRSKRLGAVFEARALEYLEGQRLRLVARNVTCRGGEIDLVMREPDGSLVFVEVRARAGRNYGGAIASAWATRSAGGSCMRRSIFLRRVVTRTVPAGSTSLPSMGAVSCGCAMHFGGRRIGAA
jgi:putative endonuclease